MPHMAWPSLAVPAATKSPMTIINGCNGWLCASCRTGAIVFVTALGLRLSVVERYCRERRTPVRNRTSSVWKPAGPQLRNARAVRFRAAAGRHARSRALLTVGAKAKGPGEVVAGAQQPRFY